MFKHQTYIKYIDSFFLDISKEITKESYVGFTPLKLENTDMQSSTETKNVD
jgi:hypothetical protein